MKKKKSILKKAISYGLLALGVFFLYALGCFLIPPMFEKDSVAVSALQHTEHEGVERVRLVDDNQDALEIRLNMLARAKESVVLAVFDFHDDEAGRDMISALYDTANRGVDVKIIIDGMYEWLRLSSSNHFKALASHKNVTVKVYNPISLALWKINYKMHDKYLIIDGKEYLLGGRNIGNVYLGTYSDEPDADRDVYVYETDPTKTSSLTDLEAYFTSVWAGENAETLSFDEKDYRSEGEELKVHYKALKEEYAGILIKDYSLETVDCDHVELLSNPIEASTKQEKLWEEMKAMLSTGREISIVTPYCIIEEEDYEFFRNLTKTATVNLYINSSVVSRNLFGAVDYLSEREALLETGMNVCEWQGDKLHTKTVLIDKKLSVIGSFNFDVRSFRLDTELMLAIDSETLGEQLGEELEKMKDECLIQKEGEPDTVGKDYPNETFTVWEKMLYTFLRVVLKPFRYLC